MTHLHNVKFRAPWPNDPQKYRKSRNNKAHAEQKRTYTDANIHQIWTCICVQFVILYLFFPVFRPFRRLPVVHGDTVVSLAQWIVGCISRMALVKILDYISVSRMLLWYSYTFNITVVLFWNIFLSKKWLRVLFIQNQYTSQIWPIYDMHLHYKCMSPVLPLNIIYV